MGKRRRKKSRANEEEEEDDDSDNAEDTSFVFHPVVTQDMSTIFFCGEINRVNVVTFARMLHSCSQRLNRRAWESGFDRSDGFITVNLTTSGGEAECGLSAADHIMACAVPVRVIIDGEVSSAGTLLAMGATESLRMRRHATMLVHQLSSSAAGKLTDLQDYTDNCHRVDALMKKLYLERCPSLDHTKLEELMKREHVMDAEEALRYGFIDSIY